MTKRYTFIIQKNILEVYDKIKFIPIIKDINLDLISSEYFLKLNEIKNIAERILFIKTNEDNLIKEVNNYIEVMKDNSLKEKDINKKIKYFEKILDTYLINDKDYLFKFANSIQLLEITNIRKIIKNENIKKIYFYLICDYNINFIIFCHKNRLVQFDKELIELTNNINKSNNEDYKSILFKNTGLFEKESNRLDLSYISDTYFLEYLDDLIKNKNINICCLIKNTTLMINNVLRNEEYLHYIDKNLEQLLILKEDNLEEKISLLFKYIDIEENYTYVINLIYFLIKNKKESLLDKIILKSNDTFLKKEIECLLLNNKIINF